MSLNEEYLSEVGQNLCGNTTKSSPLESVLNALDTEIENLSVSILSLHDDLKPITTDAPREERGNRPQEVVSGGAIVNRIESLVKRLQGQVDYVRFIKSILDL